MTGTLPEEPDGSVVAGCTFHQSIVMTSVAFVIEMERRSPGGMESPETIRARSKMANGNRFTALAEARSWGFCGAAPG